MRIAFDATINKPGMFITKMKCNALGPKLVSEIKFLPERIGADAVADCVSIAMAPAVLGLVKVPDRFVVVLGKIFKEMIKNPEIGTPKKDLEAHVRAYEKFKEFVQLQENFERNQNNGFKDIYYALNPQEIAVLF